MTETDRSAVFPRPRTLAWLLTIAGLVGLVAAFVLTVEKIILLKNPDYVPSCSINPVLSCGSVMETPQAELFGFPNPLIGVVGFSVVVTLGVVMVTGYRPPRWVFLGLQVGATAGMVFVGWLIYQSLYRIGALCPYCMVVWVAMSVIFWYVTLHNLTARNLPVPVAAEGVVRGVARVHTALLLAWFLLVVILIGEAFWTYWRTLLIIG